MRMSDDENLVLSKEQINKISNKISDQVIINAKEINNRYIARIHKLFERSEARLTVRFLEEISRLSHENQQLKMTLMQQNIGLHNVYSELTSKLNLLIKGTSHGCGTEQEPRENQD